MKAVICNGMLWKFNNEHPDDLIRRWATPEALGFLLGFLNVADKRSAREQLDTNYDYGGHWQSGEPYGMLPDGAMTYPGDPPMPWSARTKLRDEEILFYPYAYVTIVQPDTSFVIQRMD